MRSLLGEADPDEAPASGWLLRATSPAPRTQGLPFAPQYRGHPSDETWRLGLLGLRSASMASQRDKEIMARRGQIMDELNRRAIREAAKRTPGENIEIGLRLSDFARGAAQGPIVREEKIPLVQVWRALKARKKA